MTSDFPTLVFVLSTTILLLTPGPTNTLLAAAGLGRGSREAFPLIGFALAGYLIAILGWEIFLTSMQNYYPWLSMIVRVVCSCYLLYVAVKLWMSAEKPPISGSKAIGPATVFVTTMLNPKGLLFASTIFPPQAFDNMQVYLITTALFACMVVPIGIIWVVFGAVVGSGRVISVNPVKVQRALALVIAVFSATIVWTAIH
ncbi:MAG: LysE family translocator [Nitrospira sp.]|nr:LysE family translocator [Nitrospira sp.]MDH4243770.1 LysE family translocator [Nitrospira sp.]MDH4356436.1 LysE family translocator [Nitrospira sp.]MDH5318782.1 LysE family translocator [Nitrospira sp.]